MTNIFRVVVVAYLLLLPWVLWPGTALPHDLLVLDQDSIPQVIHWSSEYQQWGGASGVVVSPFVVLTARHVVGEDVDTRRAVVFTGRVLRAPIVSCVSPKGVDFAVLLVEVPVAAHPDHLVRINEVVPQRGAAVTIAGYPNGKWTTLVTQVMYETTTTRIRWNGEPVPYPHIVWVAQADERIGWFGFSGGAVFDGEGALRGIICCVSDVYGFIGFVPIKYGIASCPFAPR